MFPGSISLILRYIEENNDFKKSIYDLSIKRGKDNYALLKLYGYVKIFKNKDNSIFKYNYFYDYFLTGVSRYGIDIFSVAKEEMYILDDGILKTPMEVI